MCKVDGYVVPSLLRDSALALAARHVTSKEQWYRVLIQPRFQVVAGRPGSKYGAHFQPCLVTVPSPISDCNKDHPLVKVKASVCMCVKQMMALGIERVSVYFLCLVSVTGQSHCGE